MEKEFIFFSTESCDGWKPEFKNVVKYLRENNIKDDISLSGITIEKHSSAEIIVNRALYSYKEQDCDKQLQQYENNDEQIQVCDIEKLAAFLHQYLDSIGPGKQLLHLIWCIKNYIPSPSDVVEFYGALQRFLCWFNGSLSIITCTPTIAEEWNGALPFNIVDSSTKIVSSTLQIAWRGSLGIKYEDKKQLELYPEVALICENENLALFPQESRVIPVAEIFGQVDISSLHLVNIRPASICYFQITDNCSIDQRTVVSEIFSSFETIGVGTLIRIRYSSEQLKDRKFSTTSFEEWKQAAGNDEDLSLHLHFESCHECLTLLIVPEEITKDKAFAVVLQDVSACGEDIIKLFTQPQYINCSIDDVTAKNKVVQLFKDTPEISSIPSLTLGKLLLHVSKEIIIQFKKKGQNIDDLWEETKKQLEVITSEEILKRLLMFPTCKNEILSLKTALPEASAPLESWPEYEAFAQEEKSNQRSMGRSHSGDFLAGLPPPPPLNSIVPLDATELLRLFSPDGQPSEAAVMNMVKLDDMVYYKCNSSLCSARTATWPDVLYIKNHGIYYNRDDKDEKFEQRCNRAKERYIRQEMASTCSLFQEKCSSYVTIGKSSDKEKYSSGSSFSPRDPVLKNSVTKDIPRNKGSVKRSRQGIAIQQLPLRRSPRKKMKEDHSLVKPSDLLKRQPSTSSTKAAASKTSKQRELSDVHKQKLRNAVLLSLESEGITMNDGLFKLYFKKLFDVCRTFAVNVIGLGSTSRNFEKIAKANVKQVIHFEKLKMKKKR